MTMLWMHLFVLWTTLSVGSTRELSFFLEKDDGQLDRALLKSAGLDATQVHKNHPATLSGNQFVRVLKNAMHGGPPVLMDDDDDFLDDPSVRLQIENEQHASDSPMDSPQPLQQVPHKQLVKGLTTPSPPKGYTYLRAPTANNQQPQRPKSTMSPPHGTIHGPSSATIQLRQAALETTTSTIRPPKPQFDFVVAGFPKCGTTTLLKAFAAHNETDMFGSEQCAIAAKAQADHLVLQKLDTTLSSMKNNDMKRAFKCPTAMYNYKSIIRMEKHSPRSKFVVGIRHPVKMMQSFYNYRVTELYERNLDESIPDFVDLAENRKEPWKGVSLSSVRFELFLQQLGKTVLSPSDLWEMSQATEAGYELAVKPSNFTVFLYTVDQLEDMDETRSANLRSELQRFLELTTPIAQFGHENKNHRVGDSGHPESIHICDPRYASIRKRLIDNGVKTATWLRDHFLMSPDVIVANPEHFIETLELWSIDPCEDEFSVPPVTVVVSDPVPGSEDMQAPVGPNTGRPELVYDGAMDILV